MLVKIRKWWWHFVRTLIITPADELYPDGYEESISDTDRVLASSLQFIKTNQSGKTFILPYVPRNHRVVESLRNEGCIVELLTTSGGELYYAIHIEKTPVNQVFEFNTGAPIIIHFLTGSVLNKKR